jgi:hypothetical protein
MPNRVNLSLHNHDKYRVERKKRTKNIKFEDKVLDAGPGDYARRSCTASPRTPELIWYTFNGGKNERRKISDLTSG